MRLLHIFAVGRNWRFTPWFGYCALVCGYFSGRAKDNDGKWYLKTIRYNAPLAL